MALFQQFPEVLYLEALDLFVLEPIERGDVRAANNPADQDVVWEKRLVMEGVIDPGPLGTFCSWSGQQANRQSQSRCGHVIRFLEERTA